MTQAKPVFKNLLLLLLVFGVALLVATLGIQASSMTSAKAQEKPALTETQPQFQNLITGAPLNPSAPSSICYTCGGNWPNFGGTIPTASAATERNGSCAGFPSGAEFSTERNDTIPYLCTK